MDRGSDHGNEYEDDRFAQEDAEDEKPVDMSKVDGDEVEEDEWRKREVGGEVVETFDVGRRYQVASTGQEAAEYDSKTFK